MYRLQPIALLIFFTTAHAGEARFSGSASLAKPATPATSANGRYSLHADLRPAPIRQGSGRFSVLAKLQPDAKALATACGPVVEELFKNGFE